MTVNDLCTLLASLPGDRMVVVRDYERRVQNITGVWMPPLVEDYPELEPIELTTEEA